MKGKSMKFLCMYTVKGSVRMHRSFATNTPIEVNNGSISKCALISPWCKNYVIKLH